MYVEFRRRTRAGLEQLAMAPAPLYERAERFRIHEHHVVLGLLQTASYMRAAFEYSTEFLGAPNDLDETLATRIARPSVLHEGARTFAVVHPMTGRPCTNSHHTGPHRDVTGAEWFDNGP